MKPSILSILFLLISQLSFGQKLDYSILSIPDSLKQNANAVVRLNKVTIDISSQKSMTIKSFKVVTVLNELGLRNLDLSENHDRNRRISQIEATAYDAFGKEIKRYKRKDFRDVSVADGFSIFSDNRALYLDYTPTSYPFTIVMETEIQTSNTAFISPWLPIDNYLVSTEKTVYAIQFKPELNLKKKEANFSGKYKFEKEETTSSINYSAQNLVAVKREELSPSFVDIFPIVYFALERFSLENVEGEASDWSEFGKWMYDSLLSDTEEIPEQTISKVKGLIGNEKNPIEIAKIVYKYVQEKTRYVSVQVGIGGWKPMLAKDVDKLGYGDCKALTNYTRCLLKCVGVPSYYTVVYSDDDETRDLQSDFASVQGNHIILSLPVDDTLVWLECTSQIHPFGFQGDGTDDRNVLLVKPEGGEIIKTKIFTEKDNLQIAKGTYQISENGDLTGKLKIVSNGLLYENEFVKERMSKEDQIDRYKEEFSNINNLKVKKISLNNNPKTIEFTEDLEFDAEGYAQKSGEKLLFALNAFDQNSFVPKKYRTREFPFEMDRGYTNESETEIIIPAGFTIEAKPNGLEQDTEFGYYKIEFNLTSPTTILCKRKLVIKKGFYDKSKYENYRKFREAIAKTDNSKIVITKA
ncbi:DUF3857 domain-containing protein [Flavobacterium sp. 25HG05S-40]|uniref:DUF3857 domain-containing protein n=1 Tax=Flavobacterium sp. 25HG05S-40 TaxID=3458682 RepID=UPI0040442990